jgi:hypothetical protein
MLLTADMKRNGVSISDRGRLENGAGLLPRRPCYDRRIALDGAPKSLTRRAKDLAAKQLAKLAGTQGRKESCEARGAGRGEAPPAPTPPPETAPEIPEQLRARVRAVLLAPERVAAFAESAINRAGAGFLSCT